MKAALPFAIALAALAGTARADDAPLIVAVNYPLAYFAERLTGDGAEVLLPVPEGADPAFWEPKIADIGRIQQADLILLNGAGFAAWTARASLPRARLAITSQSFAESYIASETITHSHGAEGEHSHTATAAFTWLDPAQAGAQAGAIADALAARGLVSDETLAPRRAALAADLDRLDAAAERLRTLAAGRVLIATHPRYQYLARAYGLDIRALDWGAGAAPGAEQLAALAGLQAETGATVLLWEAAPPESARAAVLALGFADSVFPTLSMPPAEGDFLSAFEAAVDDLAAALAQLPPR